MLKPFLKKIAQMVPGIGRIIVQRDALLARLAEVVPQRDVLLVQKDQLNVEIKGLQQEQTALLAQCAALQIQKDTILSENFLLQTETNALREQNAQFDGIDKAVQSLYPGDDVYFEKRPDLRAAVEKGLISCGLQHFIQNGFIEYTRSKADECDALKIERDTLKRCIEDVYPGNKLYYLRRPDIQIAVEKGEYDTGLDHFIAHGLAEILDNKLGNDKSALLNFIHGSGLDIGALHHPFPVPNGTKVTYVDRMSKKELQAQYPELEKVELIDPDVIDDAQHLATINDGTQDFVIASHVLEHLQDPIGAIENFLRILKSGGTTIIILPDGRFNKDRHRPVTEVGHLFKDYWEGPEWSKVDHYREYSEYVHRRVMKWITTDEEVERDVKRMIGIDYSIHFHVWTPLAFQELLAHCSQHFKFAFDLELFQKNRAEFSVVLRKTKISPS